MKRMHKHGKLWYTIVLFDECWHISPHPLKKDEKWLKDKLKELCRVKYDNR